MAFSLQYYERIVAQRQKVSEWGKLDILLRQGRVSFALYLYPVKQKYGNIIRIIRQNKSLSQQNMADEMGITVSSYSKMERGEIDIKLSRLLQIAEALDVPLSEIIGDTALNEPIFRYQQKSDNQIGETLAFLLDKVNKLEKELFSLKQQMKKS